MTIDEVMMAAWEHANEAYKLGRTVDGVSAPSSARYDATCDRLRAAIESYAAAKVEAERERACKIVASERHEVAANAAWSEPDFDPRPEVVELLESVEADIRGHDGSGS